MCIWTVRQFKRNLHKIFFTNLPEISTAIFTANQLTGFFVRTTLALNGLTETGTISSTHITVMLE